MLEKEATRDNHYVPRWYQRGFLLPDRNKLCYLNLSPDTINLPDGSAKALNALHHNAPSQCFYETDLYSTFFGSHINDEVEKKLFGDIDDKGARAVRAFLEDDAAEWHRYFQDFFIYLDAQKLRTPKGLDWLKAQYPQLEQNALMREMQGVRTYNCTIWSECVREIVSAKNSGVKFVISDHPITIYNYARPPDHGLCAYPNEPSIALKASQTIFALDKERCLILTNLEYAKKSETTNPVEKRTFARHIRQSVVQTNKFIRKRDLRDDEVVEINYLLKKRARRYIASGNEEWLYPEESYKGTWSDIKRVLSPPEDELWHFGGEIFAGFEDGGVYYQDAFGRKAPKSDALNKNIKESELGPNDSCGCGSGKKYKKCCKRKPAKLRPSWKVLSIRERNTAFFRGLNRILGIEGGKDWTDVRRELDESKVKEIHELYGFLWPPETDVFELLPKPDGSTRAVFSGLLDPRTTPFITANASLYFGELLVQNPFLNHNQVDKKFSPVEHPNNYLTQTLKNAFLFLQLFPLIKIGRINLFPDPCSVDPFLQRSMMEMAEERSKVFAPAEHDREIFDRIHKEEFSQTLLMLPRDTQEGLLRQADPDAPDEVIRYCLDHLAYSKENNPLVLLREDVYGGGEEGGQLMTLQMIPNFEMLLFVAQATGSFVVTDSLHRWSELQLASHREDGLVANRLPDIDEHTASSQHTLVADLNDAHSMYTAGKVGSYRRCIERLYLKLADRATEDSFEGLIDDLQRARHAAQKEIAASTNETFNSRFRFLAPRGGIYHNHVQRLMVRCGIEERPENVSLAVLMDVADM